MIISIHIPKTAGTALAGVLDYAVERKIIYDYDDVVPNDRQAVLGFKEFLSRFAVIHGHFHYNKYAGVFDNARFVTCLRNPIDRVVSNYFHLMRSKDMRKFAYRKVVENNLDLVGFSALPNMARAQSIFLKGSSVDDFDMIGLTEEMDTTVRLLRKVLGLSAYYPTRRGRLGRIPVVNANPSRLSSQFRYGFVTRSVREKIRRNVEEDWGLYMKAKERFEALKREYL